jgi:hypothetical protein
VATGRGRGRGSSKKAKGGAPDDGRVKVGVAWINGAESEDYLSDMVDDGFRLRVSFDIEDLGEIPEGFTVLGFPNRNKKGKAPDFDFVALPPRGKD